MQIPHIDIASAGKPAELAKAYVGFLSILEGFCFVTAIVLDEILTIFTPRLFGR